MAQSLRSSFHNLLSGTNKSPPRASVRLAPSHPLEHLLVHTVVPESPPREETQLRLQLDDDDFDEEFGNPDNAGDMSDSSDELRMSYHRVVHTIATNSGTLSLSPTLPLNTPDPPTTLRTTMPRVPIVAWAGGPDGGEAVEADTLRSQYTALRENILLKLNGRDVTTHDVMRDWRLAQQAQNQHSSPHGGAAIGPAVSMHRPGGSSMTPGRRSGSPQPARRTPSHRESRAAMSQTDIEPQPSGGSPIHAPMVERPSPRAVRHALDVSGRIGNASAMDNNIPVEGAGRPRTAVSGERRRVGADRFGVSSPLAVQPADGEYGVDASALNASALNDTVNVSARSAHHNQTRPPPQGPMGDERGIRFSLDNMADQIQRAQLAYNNTRVAIDNAYPPALSDVTRTSPAKPMTQRAFSQWEADRAARIESASSHFRAMSRVQRDMTPVLSMPQAAQAAKTRRKRVRKQVAAARPATARNLAASAVAAAVAASSGERPASARPGGRMGRPTGRPAGPAQSELALTSPQARASLAGALSTWMGVSHVSPERTLGIGPSPPRHQSPARATVLHKPLEPQDPAEPQASAGHSETRRSPQTAAARAPPSEDQHRAALEMIHTKAVSIRERVQRL